MRGKRRQGSFWKRRVGGAAPLLALLAAVMLLACPAGAQTMTPAEETPTATATVAPPEPSATATGPTASPTVTPPPSPTPTPTVEPMCGNGTTEGDEECDDGNHFGGDGCAANCSLETATFFVSDPARSNLRFQTAQAFIEPIDRSRLDAAVTLVIGSPGADGVIPVALPVDGIVIPPVQGSGLCACFRPVEDADLFGVGNAGGGSIGCAGLSPVDFLLSRDHDTADVDPECSAFDLTTGSQACLENGAAPPACNPSSPHDGLCNGPLRSTASGSGGPGSGVFWLNLSVSVLFAPGSGDGCAAQPGNPAYGPDGLPCTEDDPDQRPPVLVPLTTGAATAAVLDANDMAGQNIGPGGNCGLFPCLTTATGAPFDCSAIMSDPQEGTDGAALGLSIPLLDGVSSQDITVAYWLNSAAGPTVTPTATLSPSMTATPSPFRTATPSTTATETRIPTRTWTPTITLTPLPTRTFTRTPTSTWTPRGASTTTPTSTGTPPPTATATRTAPTVTPPPSATATAPPADTETPVPVSSATAASTATESPQPASPTSEPTSSATPAASPTPTTGVVPGDLNGDGVLDGRDLELLIGEIFGQGGVVPPADADINGDSRIDAADVVALLQLMSE